MSELNMSYMGHVSCEYCGNNIRPSGMRQHHKTQSCQVRQTLRNIPATMEQLSYLDRNKMFDLLVTPEEQYPSVRGPSITSYHVKYRRPGWGRSGRLQSQLYVDSRLVVIIRSLVLTDDEKRACIKAELYSPEFRTAYATAALAGSNT